MALQRQSMVSEDQRGSPTEGELGQTDTDFAILYLCALINTFSIFTIFDIVQFPINTNTMIPLCCVGLLSSGHSKELQSTPPPNPFSTFTQTLLCIYCISFVDIRIVFIWYAARLEPETSGPRSAPTQPVTSRNSVSLAVDVINRLSICSHKYSDMLQLYSHFAQIKHHLTQTCYI